MPIKKKVNQYKIEGSEIKLIATYDSIKIASETTNINRNAISASLTGKHATSGGYIWKYDDKKIFPILKIPKNKRITIAQIEPYTNMITEIFPSINAASRKTGISTSSICNCLKGKNETAGKWKWIHIEDIDYNQSLSHIYKNSPYIL